MPLTRLLLRGINAFHLTLAGALLLLSPLAPAATEDTLVLGDSASEAAHGLVPTLSTTVQNEVAVSGSGTDIWGTSDQFFFRYQPLTGDGMVQVKIISSGASDPLNKVGVMMRESLATNARHASMFRSANGTLSAIYRTTSGGTTSQANPASPGTGPYWVRVVRAGNVFTMSVSRDQINWTVGSTQTITMAATIYVGQVVCARKNSVLNEAILGDYTSSASGALTPTDIGAVGYPGAVSVLGLGEPSRRLNPQNPAYFYGGDLVFNMAVDPNAQNYFTLKVWGGEGNSNRLILNIGDGNGNWFEVGGRHGNAVVVFMEETGKVSPGGFWFKTTLLPRWYTQGKTTVPIRVRSTGHFYDYGETWVYETYQYNMDSASRGIYKAYTHDDPVFVPAADDSLGNPASYATAPTRSNSDDAAFIVTHKTNYNTYLTGVINDAIPTDLSQLLSKSGDYASLCRSYEVTWTTAYQNPAVPAKLVSYLDAVCQGYYADPGSAGWAWGGSFGGHGEMLKRMASLIQPQLDAVVDLGGGTGVNRRTQYAAMLKASRDFGRMNRKTITNQAIGCDFSVYQANLGLIAINSPDAFSETAARRYAYEAIGLLEYGGSDISVASPSPTWSMGRGYYMVTARGTTREGNWTSYDDYGRMAPYVYALYRLTGDTALRDRAVQMEESHHVRMMYASVDSEGYRALLNEGAIACRNDFLPGNPTTVDPNIAASLQSPLLVGAAKQAMADGQFFRSWREKTQDMYLPDDYATLLAAADPGDRPPQLPGQPNWAWADEENGVVSIHANGEQHLLTFNRGPNGINHIGDAHSITPQFQRVVQFWVDDARFVDSGNANTVGPEVQTNFTGTPPDNPISAWNGRVQPYALDEFGQQTSAADFYSARFGDLIIGMNRTLTKTFPFAPAGFTSGVDLVSGQTMSGPMNIPPRTTVVFYSPRTGATAPEQAINPTPVDGAQLAPIAGITLAWTAGQQATTHRVYLGTAPNPGAADYKGEQSGTTYVTGALVAGATYYWRIDEVNVTGVKTGAVWKFQANTPSTYAWSSQDIGSVGQVGSHTESGGTYTVKGSGSDIWGTSDSFRFVSVPVTGDCDMRARVVSLQNTGTSAKVGVMVRETLNTNSAYAINFVTPASGIWFQRRLSTGASATSVSSIFKFAPYWVRLVRIGSTLTAYHSADGLTWTLQGSTGLFSGSSAYAGLVVCANNNSVLNTAVFDNVLVGTPAAIPTGLTTVSGHTQAALSWSPASGATSYTLKRSTVAGGPYIGVAGGLTGTTYTDSGLTNGTTYYYVVSATNALGSSLNSEVVGVTPQYAPPAVPSGLSASGGNTQAALNWAASPGATSYTVRFSTTSGGAYTTLATGVTGTSYTHTGLVNGTTYYYVVSAVGFGGESSNSLQVSALPTTSPTLPRNLQNRDIGSVGQAGSASFANGVYTIKGSGADIWYSADGFQFVSQQISGDCDIRARVTSIQNTAAWAKAGVMIRESLAANSTYAINFLTPSNGVAFQRRATTGGSASGVAGAAGKVAPYWVRLVRSGNAFTAYHSADGATWTSLGTSTITMGSSVYVGLAVCSVSNTTLNTSTFDNVSVVSLPSPWASSDIGAVGAGGSAKLIGTTYTVSGSGTDIWGAADEFRYAYQIATGDCDITARVTDVPATATWAKAGVMIRESLNANSTYAIAFLSPASGAAFQVRTSTGGNAAGVSNPTGIGAPYWVRLVRSGNTFTAYYSANGTTWTSMGSQTITMSTSVYIGLESCSNADDTLCTATFDNLTVTP